MTPLQKNLTALVKLKSISIAEVERQSGLRHGTLRNILQGKSKNPRIDILEALAKFFHCSISQMTGSSGDISPNRYFVTADLNLLNCFANQTKKVCEQNDINLSFAKFCEIQKECYEYSIQNNSREIDLKFLKWIIAKEANYNEKD